MTDPRILDDIQDIDPEGKEAYPTAAKISNFQNFVVARYGQKALDDYKSPRKGLSTYE